MKKNTFMLYNDLIYELCDSRSMEDVMRVINTHVRMLIPFRYASLLISDEKNEEGKPLYRKPMCLPDSFTEAESRYMEHIDEDPLAWLMYGNETTLIRESDLMGDESRLTTPLYQHCYSGYGIYDSMQASLIYHNEFLGILTLFRTKKEGLFTVDDVFLCRSMCTHMNRIVWQILRGSAFSSPIRTRGGLAALAGLQATYHLTPRESQVLWMIFSLMDNEEICQKLGIRETTLQKHLQNLYRKTGVSSRMELLKLN